MSAVSLLSGPILNGVLVCVFGRDLKKSQSGLVVRNKRGRRPTQLCSYGSLVVGLSAQSTLYHSFPFSYFSSTMSLISYQVSSGLSGLLGLLRWEGVNPRFLLLGTDALRRSLFIDTLRCTSTATALDVVDTHY